MQSINTVAAGTPVIVTIPENIRGYVSRIQVDVTGAGTLQIELKVAGMDTYIEAASAAQDETLVLDRMNVESVRLTTTGGDMLASVSAR